MSKKPTYEELEQLVRELKQQQSTHLKTDGALDEIVQWYSSILETINEGVIIQSASGSYLTWNKKAEDILGLTFMESSGHKIIESGLTFINEDGSKCESKDRPSLITLQTGRPCKNQVMGIYRSPGDLLWVSVNTNPIFNKNEEKPYAVAISLTDITELKMERNTSKNLLDVAGVMILALNRAGEVILINRKGCEILEGTEKDFLGKNWFDIFTPKELLKDIKDTYTEMMNNRINIHEYTEYKVLTMSGIEKVIAWHNAVIRNKDGVITGMLSSGEDITERKKAEESLHEREELLNKSQEMASLGGFIWGRHDNSLTWSKNMYAIHGIKEGSVKGDLGELSIKLIHPEDLGRVEKEISQMLEDTDTWDVEFRIVRPDGIERIIRSSGKQEYDAKCSSAKCFGIYQDITEQKEAEKRLRESEEKLLRSRKMETLGLLAGGVAHDLNNVLSGIVSYPELLLLDLPEESKLRKPIQTIHESGKRAVAIVSDLLTIARGVATPKEPLCLNDIIEDYLTSPEYKKLRQYHPDVEIKRELKKELLNITGSPIHIRKVIMNLVSNAAEAIEKRGIVIVSTMNRYVDSPTKGYEDVRPGEYVVLSVSDNGSGISPEYLERIFEPFFTKKIMGKSGTGLGLAVVWNIVQDHEGYIDVKSNKQGTKFEIYLPAIRDEIPARDLPLPIDAYKGNGETVLVVDDEKSQREITCKMVETLGYRSEAVSGGEDAVEYLKAHNADIILLDMIMPQGLGGRETYERIIKLNPKQKAIIVSGFVETDEIRETQRLGAGAYIKKPLILQKLGEAIKEELSRS
ncbi:MAG: PAS domain S-box protein [Deltaproteobacteria bacterium]|nr:PAS domain S-box protein [Deltaproteobacteria bacterium]